MLQYRPVYQDCSLVQHWHGTRGVTNHFLIRFEACSTGENLYLHNINLIKSPWWGRSQVPRVNLLLLAHYIGTLSNAFQIFIFILTDQYCRKSFSESSQYCSTPLILHAQTRVHNWSKWREEVPAEFLTLNTASRSHSVHRASGPHSLSSIWTTLTQQHLDHTQSTEHLDHSQGLEETWSECKRHGEK
jgi:hypothetical protein